MRVHRACVDKVFDRLDANLSATRQQLEALIRIPSVSADPARAEHVRNSAEAFAQILRDAGATNVAVLAVPDAHPIACGDFIASQDAPTLLVYGHHDVQPSGRADQWFSPPFEPVERDGRLYGRGAVDDKGGILAQIAAAKAWMDEANAPPCNVRFLIEGEEEIGSPHLAAFFAAHPDRIAADIVALCDTPNFATGVPALTYRLRGNCLIDVEVRTLERPLHSGRGGGAVPDPIQILCALINDLGTLDFLRSAAAELPLSKAAAAAAALHTESDLRKDFGLLPGVDFSCEDGFSPLEQTWLRPALTVTAIEARPIAEASNQIVDSARARLSIRTVPNLDNEQVGRAVMQRIAEQTAHHAQVNVRILGGPAWWRTNPEGPAFDAARRALARGYGRDAVLIGSGGSIGFVRTFADALPHAPCLLLGVEDPPCNAHAENESLDLADWRSAMRAAASLFDELSRVRA
ncbi:MAG TPA: M20/M25/M40 family metallo-hydrolase [Thermoanaerobaculia bacterium]|nr:M20/M25/M40 family metallo-hydrolase [Thermoanaerobaculia bacterium]